MNKTPVEPQQVADGVLFKYTALGQPVFVHEFAISADMSSSIRPEYWTSRQLRAMADFIDKNDNVRLMSDGSGSKQCRIIGTELEKLQDEKMTLLTKIDKFTGRNAHNFESRRLRTRYKWVCDRIKELEKE